MSQAVKYIAELKDAPDVTLNGTADLTYWQEHLKAEGLFPYRVQGRAGMTLGSVSSRFMGIRFTELIIAVFASRQADGATHDGMYLMCAYNTSRLFTFCERWLFKTPYLYGNVQIQTQTPAFLKLVRGTEAILHAEQRGTSPHMQTREETWEGTIFLPGHKQFYARLGGMTEITPFKTGTDVFTLNPSEHYPAVQCLVDSHFLPGEWHIRPKSAHARSKTVRQTD